MEAGQRRFFDNPPDSNTLRILVSTDNHAGYAEGDPLRCEDSFRTLEEIFMIAKDNDVDFILIGGDLYHYNTPSRHSHYRVTDIFKKYCLGPSKVDFEVAEDSRILFPDGKLNYHDPSLSISLPVFAIHGNHDDPSGTPALSAMDLLHQCRMLNYFGKYATADEIVIQPLKLTKGETKLNIYGFGNIRDERLKKTINNRALTWVRDEDTDDSLNIAIVHQNRYNRGHSSSFMPEQAFTKSGNAVIWCHEHQCMGVEKSATNLNILQPGSSIATSLSESEFQDKKVAILEVSRGELRVTMRPLLSVRPFELNGISLSHALPPGDICTEQQVVEFIESALETMIETANNKYISRGDVGPLPLSDEAMSKLSIQNGNEGWTPSPASSLTGMRDGRPLPLIRLRVDASGGYPKPASIRFAPRFEGRVANPESMVIYLKTQSSGVRYASGKIGNEEKALAEDKLGQLSGDDERAIFSLIHEELSKCGGLRAVSESAMTDALRDFAEKGAHSMTESLNHYSDRLVDFVHQKTSPMDIFNPRESKHKTYELVGKYIPVEEHNVDALCRTFLESFETGSIPIVAEKFEPTIQEAKLLLPGSQVSNSPVLPADSSAITKKLLPSQLPSNLLASSQTPMLKTEIPSKRKSKEIEVPSRGGRGVRVKQETSRNNPKLGAWGQDGLSLVSSQSTFSQVNSKSLSEMGDDVVEVVQVAKKNSIFAPSLFGGSKRPVSVLSKPPQHIHRSDEVEILDEGDDGDSLLAGLGECEKHRMELYRAKGCAHNVPAYPRSSDTGFNAGNRGYSSREFSQTKDLLSSRFMKNE